MSKNNKQNCTKPRVFIGSASEGADIAEALQVRLDKKCEVTVWNQDVFRLSQAGINSLVEAINKFDFAIFVLTPDDIVKSRKKTSQAPRDNVILELGLFIGGLGLGRTFAVYDEENKVKIPTDLSGVTFQPYSRHSDGNIIASVGAASTMILREIMRVGVRNVERDIADNVDAVTQDAYSAAELIEKEKALRSELEAALAAAEAANLASSTFFANISHEMRTPLNAIVGLSDMLLSKEWLPEDILSDILNINSAGSVLLSTVNDILDISKIEAGKFELIPLHYHTADLLNDIITFNMFHVDSKSVIFVIKIDENMPCEICGDELRLRQIFNNLLSNAFKYTHEGAVTLNVSCDIDSDKNMFMKISVSDTGIGIKPEDLDKLFSDYNQVDTKVNRKIEGTGLGLSITRKLVELMDGGISISSEYGKGSTFTVWVKQEFVTDKPLGSDTVENLRSLRYSYSKQSSSSMLACADMSYARILVVDDFQINLDVVSGMLKKYKIRTDCVKSGKEAIERISAGEPVYDAVFMDQTMPVMDGFESTTMIRALNSEYSRSIPVILMAPNAVTGNEKFCIDNGFQAFLTKPIDTMKLDTILNQWIKDKRADYPKAAKPGNPCISRLDHNKYDNAVSSPGSMKQSYGLTSSEATVAINKDFRALVVDDNELNINITVGMLKPYNIHIDCANSGYEAVQLVKENRYSVIFLDYMMPGMDGIATITEIRRLDIEYAKHVPVIALTACYFANIGKLFLENGFQDYLSKPINKNKLKSIIGNLTDYREPVVKQEAELVLRAKERDLMKWLADTTELDISNSIKQFDGDVRMYIGLLNEFNITAEKWLKEIWNFDDISTYLNILYQIKGGCEGLHAKLAANLADQLINAVSRKNISFISSNNKVLIDTLSALKCKISQILLSLRKPLRHEPDAGLLVELQMACRLMDNNRIAELLDKLDDFEYDSAKHLVDRLYSLFSTNDYQKMVEVLTVFDY